MKKILILILSTITGSAIIAQENVLPAAPQQSTIALTHATIHIGNGQVINDGTIVFTNGKITSVGTAAPPSDAKAIDCSGKQI